MSPELWQGALYSVEALCGYHACCFPPEIGKWKFNSIRVTTRSYSHVEPTICYIHICRNIKNYTDVKWNGRGAWILNRAPRMNAVSYRQYFVFINPPGKGRCYTEVNIIWLDFRQYVCNTFSEGAAVNYKYTAQTKVSTKMLLQKCFPK